jgi:filamentous hemagglutinin family protein
MQQASFWHQRIVRFTHWMSWYLAGSLTWCSLAPINSARAQIIPDGTLGAESSTVTPDIIKGIPSDRIDGGATRGTNLFHSFGEFNVGVGSGAYFSNPSGIENIISRVTGSNLSQIQGTLGVSGNANLFFLNPNGIVFGPNASLDVRGSFLASTANSVLFNNGFAFSATDPQAPPLLTVNVPTGLQYRGNPGAIQSQGAILQVPTGQSLTLAGGTVNINGGFLIALGGRVELAGVAALGEVGLTQQGQEWQLRVPEGLARADLAINNAIVGVIAGGGGSIALTARNLKLTGARTFLQAGIGNGLGTVGAQAGDIDINTAEATNIDASRVFNTALADGTGNAGAINITTGSLSVTNGAALSSIMLGQGNAGNINITARDAVSFDGVGSTALSTVDTSGVGNAGAINITTGSLTVTSGAALSSIMLGQGNAGNINITARDAVSFDGVGSNGAISSASSRVDPSGVGQGGDININTGSLSVTNGAALGTNISGRGDAGNINITARDRVSFDGVNSNSLSSASSSVFPSGVGQGGDINVSTGSFSVTNGAALFSATSGKGNAGNINITARDAVSFDGVNSIGVSSAALSNVFPSGVGQGGDINVTTGSLSVTNGAQLNAATLGKGNAGNINITARDKVSFGGVGSNGVLSGGFTFSTVESSGVGQGGDINITAKTLEVLSGGISARTRGLGNAGNITVKTGLFSITNGVLSVSSAGQGGAGNLDVNARQLRLDQGLISAQAATGQGGNITLQVQDFLLLRRGSFITTTAGTAQAGGDGGNITFNGNFIVAVPNEDSDISANAFTGKGGSVGITAKGIYGIRFSPGFTPLNDITASSQFGVSGQVQINGTVDPNQTVTQIPEAVVDPNALVAQSPCKRGSQSQFTRTGRGGLPPNLSDDLSGESTQVGLVKPAASVVAEGQAPRTSSGMAPIEKQTAKVENPIVPAQGWSFKDNGEVVLTAYNPSVTGPQRLQENPVGCPAF